MGNYVPSDPVELWKPESRCRILIDGFFLSFPPESFLGNPEKTPDVPAGTTGKVVKAEPRKSESGDDYVFLSVVWEGYEKFGSRHVRSNDVIGLGPA